MIDTSALREKVLDLAIRGKLVTQDPNDEPASVLLERIRAEKEQMVKDGKLKAKDIKNDTIIFKGEDNLHYEQFSDGTVKCIEDEIPFDVPEGWAWCRLGDLFKHNTGKALNASKSEGTILTYITTSNVYWDRFELNNLKSMPFADSEIEKCTVRKGDLLVCEGGDIGRAAIWNSDEDIRIQNHIHRLRPYDKINCQFYYYILYLYKLNGKINGNGIGLQGLSSNALHSIIVPLPPINGQIKIASKLEQIFLLIADVEAEKSDLSMISTAIKSKILDLAIRGKLVPQNLDDEPASVLLERIKAEKEELIKQGKIKRDKKESIIFKGEDNSYYRTYDKFTECIEGSLLFDLPSNWIWVTLPNIAQIELGKTLDQAKNKGDYHPYIRSVNVQWGHIDLTDVKSMRFEQNELERYSIKKGDMLICEGGDVGRCCIWEIEESILYQNAIHRVRFYDKINCKFYMYVMMFFEFNGILKKISNGVTIKHLTGIALSGLVCPLPPLKEQTRIVDAIETAFEQLDNILNLI